MTELIIENPVAALVLLLIPVVAAVWKALHELYVKPRDFRIDSLKEELTRFQAELERMKETVSNDRLEPIEPTRLPAPVLAEVGLLEKPTEIIVPSDDQESQSGVSTSLVDLYREWKNPALTDLQRQHFQTTNVGRKVRWRVKIDSISDISHGKIFVWVVDPTYAGNRVFGAQASAIFNERDSKTLLTLRDGDEVLLTGTIREFFISPTIEAASITSLVQTEQQPGEA